MQKQTFKWRQRSQSHPPGPLSYTMKRGWWEKYRKRSQSSPAQPALLAHRAQELSPMWCRHKWGTGYQGLESFHWQQGQEMSDHLILMTCEQVSPPLGNKSRYPDKMNCKPCLSLSPSRGPIGPLSWLLPLYPTLICFQFGNNWNCKCFGVFFFCFVCFNFWYFISSISLLVSRKEPTYLKGKP